MLTPVKGRVRKPEGFWILAFGRPGREELAFTQFVQGNAISISPMGYVFRDCRNGDRQLLYDLVQRIKRWKSDVPFIQPC